MTSKNYMFIRYINKGVVIYPKIYYHDITHIQSDKDYCKIFSSRKIYQIHITLERFLSCLPADIFCRCHRQFIVNIDRIEQIEDKTIVFEGYTVPISDRYKNEFIKNINLLPSTYVSKKQSI